MPHTGRKNPKTTGQIQEKEGDRCMDVVTGPDNLREQELTRLVEEYQTSLRRMCYVILRDEELAKDAVQETFLKVYRTKDTFRGECSEKTWLMRIAVNTCRDMRRSAWFRHTERRITPEDLPEPVLRAEDEHVELTLAIMRLPKHLREVTLLYYYQDMTVRETAEALGIAPSTVSRRLERAQEKLRTLLEGRKLHG